MLKKIGWIATLPPFLLTGTAAAIPECHQIACYPEPGCDVQLQFTQCTGGQRQWRCVWTSYSQNCQSYEMPWSWCLCENCTCGAGGGCFLAGTPITLESGRTVSIETLKEGASLLAYDVRAREKVPVRVIAVHQPKEVDHYYVINERIRLSATQPVLSGGAWVEVAQLEVGGMLTNQEGVAVPILSIRRVDETVTVYNLAVSGGTYLAHGLVVHNKDHFEYHPDHEP